jgi:hypothetical protein
MQSKFASHPRLKFLRSYEFVEGLPSRAVDTKSIKRRVNLSRLAGMPVLSTRPLKKYFWDARVWRQVVTLATHQEQVGYVVCATKRTWNDMATLERDTIPAIGNLLVAGITPPRVVSSAVVKSAGPTSRFAPIDMKAQFRETFFPTLKYVALRRKAVREPRTYGKRHHPHSHSIISDDGNALITPQSRDTDSPASSGA